MRKLVFALLFIAGSAGLVNAVVCEDAAGIICLVCLLIFALTELDVKGKRLVGTLIAGAAAGVCSFHSQLCLLLALYALIFIVSGVLAPYHKRAFWRVVSCGLCFVCGLYFLWQSCVIPAASLRLQPRKIALLERGVWGVEHSHQSALNITSQYSYNLLRTSIGAFLLDEVSDLEQYSDLVLITPTAPFTDREIERIRKWVLSGGHLIVVTDHTDLFGHVRVLEPLFTPFGIEAVKDCIIESLPETCTYYKLFCKYNGLTSNSFKGRGEAFMWQMGYSERTDYAAPSFFSDNQVTDEDTPGIYAVAMNAPYGVGMVTVFGDSTLFANFALSMPSSQRIWGELLTPRVGWSVYGALAFLVFVLLCLERNVFMRLSSVCFIIVWLAVVGVCSLSPDMEWQAGDMIILPVEGEPRLVEGEEGEFRTLFAAAYASRVFPVWHGENGSGLRLGKLSFNSLNDTESPWGQESEQMLRLAAPCSCSLDAYLDALIKDSQNKPFWFDSGAGLLRELAYRKFWLTCIGRELEKTPEFDITYHRNAILTTGSQERYELSVHMREQKEAESGWVIIGDWILGKKVKEDTILIRELWQHSDWKMGDCVITLSTL